MNDAARLPDRIVLLGYRASGKTTFGRILANRLGYEFADVDQHVCARFDGRAIHDIWACEGEPAFRAAECEVTSKLMQQKRLVIGLGGGTLMQPPARHAVEQASATVRIYLRAPAAVLYERIQQDPGTGASRPALTALGGGLEEIKAMLAEREPVYQAVADIELDVTDVSDLPRIVDELEDCVRGQIGP